MATEGGIVLVLPGEEKSAAAEHENPVGAQPSPAAAVPRARSAQHQDKW